MGPWTNPSKQRGTTTQTSFHNQTPVLAWLDALEKDFDKAFVDLDQLVGEVDSDQVGLEPLVKNFF